MPRKCFDAVAFTSRRTTACWAQFRYGDAGRRRVARRVAGSRRRHRRSRPTRRVAKWLANRDDESLLPILEHRKKNISKPRHTVQMVNIANCIVDL